MNSACCLPLFSSDDLDLPVAWRDEGGRAVSRSRRRLLAEAALLAEKMSPHLAPGAGIVNLCNDRYHFALGFVAGLLLDAVSL